MGHWLRIIHALRRGGLTLSVRTVSLDFSHLDIINVKFEALIGVEPNALWAILKTLDYGEAL